MCKGIPKRFPKMKNCTNYTLKLKQISIDKETSMNASVGLRGVGI